MCQEKFGGQNVTLCLSAFSVLISEGLIGQESKKQVELPVMKKKDQTEWIYMKLAGLLRNTVQLFT